MSLTWRDLLDDPDTATWPEIEEAAALAGDILQRQREGYGDAEPAPSPTPKEVTTVPFHSSSQPQSITEEALSDARLRSENFAAKVQKVKAQRGEHSESYRRMSQEFEKIKREEYELQNSVEDKIVRDAAWIDSLRKAEEQVRAEAAEEEKQLQDSINSNITRNSPAWNWMSERLKERHLSESEIAERTQQRASEIFASIEAGPPPDAIYVPEVVDPLADAKGAYIAEQIRLGASPTEAAAKAAAIEKGTR
jgi:hypothetical protein